MSAVLKDIAQATRARVASLPFAPVERRPRCDLLAALTAARKPAIISEIKFASPSRGRIHPGTEEPVTIATAYQAAGASAISILTEPSYFSGDIRYLQRVRTALPDMPILQKDFILDVRQIIQAINAGADAILLIVALLTDSELHTLYAFAIAHHVTVLVEIHNQQEAVRALALNPALIGINSRNLHTMTVSLENAKELIKMIPPHILCVCESGLQSASDVTEMQACGFKVFLMGEVFMKHVEPGRALSALRGELKLGGEDEC